MDLASGNLGGATIAAAAASCMQQPNYNSMPNLALATLLLAVTVM